MNTREMIAVMQAYEDGKQIEAKLLSDPDWYSVEKPLWDWDSFVYRIKTTKKVVDLSVLIDSGIANNSKISIMIESEIDGSLSWVKDLNLLDNALGGLQSLVRLELEVAEDGSALAPVAATWK